MGEMAESLRISLEHSKTEYKQLGKSGLRVSVPILGAMSFGHPDWLPWVLDEEKVALHPLANRTLGVQWSDDSI